MLVTPENIRMVRDWLGEKSELAFDCETTGLQPYAGDKIFSVIIGDDERQFYFNFHDYQDETFYWQDFGPLLELARTRRTWVGFNAKFDLAMLENAGISLVGDVWCCQAMARVVNSEANPFASLADYGRKLGVAKDDGVEEWFKRNKVKEDDKKYCDVPFNIIVPYGLQDVAVTFALYKSQKERLKQQKESYSVKEIPQDLYATVRNEVALLRVVYEMERIGVKIDREFCEKAKEHCQFEMSQAVAEFRAITGHPFKKSGKLFQEVFADEKERWVYGPPTKVKGERNPKFDADILKTFKNPAAESVLDYSAAKANYNFYEGFLASADPRDIIHTHFNQHGTNTGRFSSSSPNLQNIKKAEEDEVAKVYTPRRAIVPRSGAVFHMIDYDQMEYRLMLHYAASLPPQFIEKNGVNNLIEEIKGGKDVHQATADLAGITRKQAKTANFALLYGSGNKLMADRLGITESEARGIRDSIFCAAPEINSLIRLVMKRGEKRGFIVNWYGRRCRVASDASYRGPNYLIQSGCSSIVKVAMVKCQHFLSEFETNMVLTIHDELVFEGPTNEAKDAISGVKHIMENVFISDKLPLTCGVDHSLKSLADKVGGIYGDVK